jgi:hypothetical protein
MFGRFNRLFIALFLPVFFLSSCSKDDESSNALDPNTYSVPLLTTNNVTEITQQTAVSGGKITSDGGSFITSKGICWSTMQHPTIMDSKFESGSGAAEFNCLMSGLSVGTTYFVRSFAQNEAGTGYGSQVVFTTSDSLIIGVNYAGGIVFYLDSTGEHGLVCTESDLRSNATWGCASVQVPGADGTALGTGAKNTRDLVNNCATLDNAAGICDSLEYHGYSDWFLPSREELKLMYVNLKAQGLGNFSDYAYWSSSEMTSNNAWQIIFNNGLQQGASKSGVAYVRAVRPF